MADTDGSSTSEFMTRVEPRAAVGWLQLVGNVLSRSWSNAEKTLYDIQIVDGSGRVQASRTVRSRVEADDIAARVTSAIEQGDPLELLRAILGGARPF